MQDDYIQLQLEALKMLEEKGIFTVAASSSIVQYHQSLELAKKSRYIIPAFGMFANYAKEYDPNIHQQILNDSLLLSEIGLTKMNNEEPSFNDPEMERVFKIFLEHAEKTGKIVICHSSSADEETLTLMDSYSLPGVVIHGFRASHKLLNKIIENGYYVSVGFLITNTFKESPYWENRRSVAKDIPIDLLLTETDGPALKFGLNPESVIEVVETLAKLKKTSHQEIKETVFKNFNKLLKKDPKLQKYQDFLSQK